MPIPARSRRPSSESGTGGSEGLPQPKSAPTSRRHPEGEISRGDFKKTYKEENPDSKKASEVGKVGGERWRSISDEEKKTCVDKAVELKAEYEEALNSNKAEDGEAKMYRTLKTTCRAVLLLV